MKRIIAVIVLIGCLCGTACADVFVGQPPKDWDLSECLTWTLLRVDEGDAMLVECGGESMLVDGGPKPFREDLYNVLAEKGLTHLHYVFSTHFHDDHINGIYFLFKDYGVTADEYMHPYSDMQISQHDYMKRTAAIAEKRGIPMRRIWDGDEFTVGRAQFHVLRCTEFSNQNAKSAVLRLTYGDCSALLCADITGAAQNWFAETVSPELLKADLIKMPHHGITPAASEFLDKVDPAFALLTTRSEYLREPSRNQLDNREIPYLFSGDGRITCVSNGVDWYIVQAEGEF